MQLTVSVKYAAQMTHDPELRRCYTFVHSRWRVLRLRPAAFVICGRLSIPLKAVKVLSMKMLIKQLSVFDQMPMWQNNKLRNRPTATVCVVRHSRRHQRHAWAILQ